MSSKKINVVDAKVTPAPTNSSKKRFNYFSMMRVIKNLMWFCLMFISIFFNILFISMWYDIWKNGTPKVVAVNSIIERINSYEVVKFPLRSIKNNVRIDEGK